MQEVTARGPKAGPANLLDASFLARLERLRVVAKRASPSQSAGERRSTLKGSSVEFADHRDYQPGDDPRLLDWNAYARLEKLFVKLFLHEADIAVHILLDASASMGSCDPSAPGWDPEGASPGSESGRPGAQTAPGPKFLLARRLAGALAYVALSNLDRAGLASLGGRAESHAGGPVPGPGGAPDWVWAPERGRGRILRMLRWLEALRPAGSPDPVVALRRYAERQRRPGLSVVVSDFLDPRFKDALKALLHHRHEVWCLHVLSPEDAGEGLSGDIEIVDCETGARREISAVPEVLAAHRRTVEAFKADLEAWACKHSVGYQFVGSEAAVEDVLMSVLRRRRLVR